MGLKLKTYRGVEEIPWRQVLRELLGALVVGGIILMLCYMPDPFR